MEMMGSRCEGPYTGKYLKQNDFEIKAQTDLQEGWEKDEVCFKFTDTTGESFKIEKMSFKQNKNLACDKSLSIKQQFKNKLSFNSTTKEVNLHQEVITNAEPSCPITDCLLFSSDCKSRFVSSDVQLRKKNDEFFLFLRSLDIQQHKVCIFCTNKYQSLKVSEVQILTETTEKAKKDPPPYHIDPKQVDEKLKNEALKVK